MLRLNTKALFAARLIDRPQAFLRRRGFSPSTATQIITGDVSQVKLKVLERLCLALNCTPHDVLEWEPDEGVKEPLSFELSALIKEKEIIELNEQVRGLTLTEIKDINRYILEKRNKSR
jgi:DNA-binding Xre family transcriptional regulator